MSCHCLTWHEICVECGQVTVGDLIKNEDFDWITWRVTTPEDWNEEDMYYGDCKSENGELISLDGDTYSKNEIVKKFWRWSDDDVKNGLTVVVEAEWYRGSEFNKYLESMKE